MSRCVIEPIGGHARAFLRQVLMHEGALRVAREEELALAAECRSAGYLDHARGDRLHFRITEKGKAYLDRLMRCH